MKTWYCVTSSFDDKGRVTAGVTATQDSENKPESSFTSTARKDVYNEWFDSLKEAQAFVEEAKLA